MTRVLVVAPYPPSTDPLAATALAYVRALRAAGHVVDVWSPEPSAARYHGRLTAPAGLLTLARVTRGCDRVRVYFRADCHPAPPAAAQGMLRVALRAALGPVPRVEVVPCGPDAAASPTFVMFVAAGADVVQPDRTEDAP
ncbi:MAG TPA: hypothetical protein VFC99_07255, partial [Acidimicrobiia bacterium]|nr:hypothetical protein [Acidimicrobiia bacterium]